MAEKLPFGGTIWTNGKYDSPHVRIFLYGEKVARLWAGSPGAGDHLDVTIGKHAELSAPVHAWEELAAVVNEALAQHRAYLAGLETRPPVEPDPGLAESLEVWREAHEAPEMGGEEEDQ